MKLNHSGSLGDIVYSLPTILALNQENNCKASLYLKTGQAGNYAEGIYHPAGNLRMDIDGALFLLPLLRAQPYLESVQISHGETVDLDLDLFRLLPIDFRSGHIARWYFWSINVCWDLSLPWLTVEPVGKGGIVVNRSFRYRNPGISYGFLRNYGKVCFVGLEEEFIAMRREMNGGIEWIETPDALELARVISSAGLFIGNQSLPFALAEGLKVPRILEVCPWCPNVVPHGPQAWDVLTQRLFEGLVARVLM